MTFVPPAMKNEPPSRSSSVTLVTSPHIESPHVTLEARKIKLSGASRVGPPPQRPNEIQLIVGRVPGTARRTIGFLLQAEPALVSMMCWSP